MWIRERIRRESEKLEGSRRKCERQLVRAITDKEKRGREGYKSV